MTASIEQPVIEEDKGTNLFKGELGEKMRTALNESKRWNNPRPYFREFFGEVLRFRRVPLLGRPMIEVLTWLTWSIDKVLGTPSKPIGGRKEG